MTGGDVKIDLPYVHEDVDRHGNVRVYFRRRKGAAKIRLKEPVGSSAFMAEYRAAMAKSAGVQIGAAAVKANTLRWLYVQYLESPPFRRLDPGTQKTRRSILEAALLEPTEPGAETCFADFPLERLTPKAIKVLRDRKAQTAPHAADNRLKALRVMFAWAEEAEMIASSPATHVKGTGTPLKGHHSWTVEEVRRFEERHPVGTKARLALALFLFTGQRRSDVVLFGRQHVREGWLRFTQVKNGRRNPVTLELPVLPALERIIAQSPCGALTFLETAYGRPFTFNGFGNKFRDWCDEAGLPHCSAHGLRKAGATIAAENGATEYELMAIFGWRDPKQAAYYVRAARQKVLAGAAMEKLMVNEGGTKDPHRSRGMVPHRKKNG